MASVAWVMQIICLDQTRPGQTRQKGRQAEIHSREAAAAAAEALSSFNGAHKIASWPEDNKDYDLCCLLLRGR